MPRIRIKGAVFFVGVRPFVDAGLLLCKLCVYDILTMYGQLYRIQIIERKNR